MDDFHSISFLTASLMGFLNHNQLITFFYVSYNFRMVKINFFKDHHVVYFEFFLLFFQNSI
jgi:hypothetical protein